MGIGGDASECEVCGGVGRRWTAARMSGGGRWGWRGWGGVGAVVLAGIGGDAGEGRSAAGVDGGGIGEGGEEDRGLSLGA